MSGIYVPIDYSDIKNVIPPGEDIIYSTLCIGFTLQSLGTKTKTYRWASHVLMTPNGVAYTFPDMTKRKAPPKQVYSSWDKFDTIVSKGKSSVGINARFVEFRLVREENYESKEKFKDRLKEFIAKFRPLLIKKKEQWLELNRDNPEIKKRSIKRAERSILWMKKAENKRLAKEAKKK